MPIQFHLKANMANSIKLGSGLAGLKGEKAGLQAGLAFCYAGFYRFKVLSYRVLFFYLKGIVFL